MANEFFALNSVVDSLQQWGMCQSSVAPHSRQHSDALQIRGVGCFARISPGIQKLGDRENSENWGMNWFPEMLADYTDASGSYRASSSRNTSDGIK